MDALTFLQDVTGFTQAQADPASRPVKLATIDPSYDPTGFSSGTLPRVTFDGEDVLTVKQYPVMAPYWPTPSDRVVMVPAGHTYVVAGRLGGPPTIYAVVAASGFTANGAVGRVEFGDTVRLRGNIQKDSGDISRAENFATLPTQLRPSSEVRVPVAVGNTSSEINVSSCRIQSSGAMDLLNAESFLDSIGVVYLDGVSFWLP